MKKSTEVSNQKQDGKITSLEVGENAEVSLNEQVLREFEYSEDCGEPESEQLKVEFNEPHYTLPSPMKSREDLMFANRNPDQMGESFGLAFQRNEPLDPVEKIEARDENRWELNPASDTDSND
ncbi:MAG: DUF6335 family protein [Acidobacteriota bacterium]